MRIPTYLILSAIWLFACQSESKQSESKAETQPEQAPRALEPQTDALDEDAEWIVFFGNSLVAGYGLSQEDAFPALVQRKIRDLELNYKVYNAGESGATSADGVSRIDFLLNQVPPISVFVLELGANDGLRGIQPTETQNNLQSIIDKVKTRYPEVAILIAGMEVPPNMGDAYADEFRAVFRNLAIINQTALIPFLLEGVAGEPELNQEDGIHPTKEGHQIVSEHVWQYLEGLL
ncbi:MAG: arylesterase [Bacteroidota bacterium]